jgi:hypothetical protein
MFFCQGKEATLYINTVNEKIIFFVMFFSDLKVYGMRTTATDQLQINENVKVVFSSGNFCCQSIQKFVFSSSIQKI